MNTFFEDMVADADEFTSITDEGGATLTNLVTQLQKVEAEIQDAEDAVKSLKAEKRRLAEELIPSKMEEMGVEKFETRNAAITIKPIVHASIPQARKEEAFNWLRSEGHGDIIKNEVAVAFAMGQDNQAGAVLDDLRQQGLDPKQKTFVHPSTLKAFVKDCLENGTKVDLDMMGAYVAKTAVVKGK
jgi:seryl-tRNA synthetase